MYVRRYPDRWLWMHRRWREPAEMTNQEPGTANPELRTENEER